MTCREAGARFSTLPHLHPPMRGKFRPGHEVCGGDWRQRAMKLPLPADPPAASLWQGDGVSAAQSARHGWQPSQSEGVRLTTAHHTFSSITLGASAPPQANGGIDGGRGDRLVRARRLRAPARDHAPQFEGTRRRGRPIDLGYLLTWHSRPQSACYEIDERKRGASAVCRLPAPIVRTALATARQLPTSTTTRLARVTAV
jgi:hypothetical protein